MATRIPYPVTDDMSSLSTPDLCCLIEQDVQSAAHRAFHAGPADEAAALLYAIASRSAELVQRTRATRTTSSLDCEDAAHRAAALTEVLYWIEGARTALDLVSHAADSHPEVRSVLKRHRVCFPDWGQEASDGMLTAYAMLLEQIGATCPPRAPREDAHV